MKKILSIVMAVLMLFTLNVPAVMAEEDESLYFIQQLSKMVRRFDTEDFFTTLAVTIGNPDMVIDGKTVPIDKSGSVAYIENGRTMMPVRGIAEAMGAEVSYVNETKTIKVETEDTMISMSIGDYEMNVNGESVSLLTAPEIKEDRTMLPVRDVAEALDCEVEWDAETKTAVFTKDFQTKRVVIYSENADANNAVASFAANGKTVAQFESVKEAKECVENNLKKGLKAEPDYVRVVDSLSWGADAIGGDAYSTQTDYVSGIAVVAVIDTGIDYGHDMFNGRITDGHDFYYNDNHCEDERGHGTHVSSTIIDIAGSNPDIMIMPLKVFGKADSCSSLMVAEAIKYAADHGADVINLSLGGNHRSEIEQQAVDYANSKNVAVVAAAGNDSYDLEYVECSPAGLDGVITVSSVDEDYALSDFSNYGEGVVEFAAPGSFINGAKLGGGYCYLSGTSMASPHVAAAYAMVKAVHPDVDTDEITEALEKNAIDIGDSRYFGAGLIKVDMLEKYLSQTYANKAKAANVTQTNAVISGEIEYTGIIPCYVGLMIDSIELYASSYIEDGDDKMHIEIDINKDLGLELVADTEYNFKFFANQGGITRNLSTVSFRTKDIEKVPEPKPEPTPEPKPEPEPIPPSSELKIVPDSYPLGELVEGSTYGISGLIKSNYRIKEVSSCILNADKRVVQEVSDRASSSSYVLEGSALDVGLRFETLAPGTYYVRYYASDEGGKSVGWTSNPFKIIAKKVEPPAEPTETGVVLIPDVWENLSIRTGPSTDYKIVGSMNHTVKCKVYTNRTKNGWYYVECNGVSGYAAGNYIYLASETKTGIVSIPSSWENLSIRTGPSTNYVIVGSMDHGEKCTIFTDKTKNGWYYVECGGVYGYAAGNCIK